MNTKATESGANPYLTAEHWRKVIAGSTRGLTAEQIALAAESAAEKTRNGIVTGAWHEAAIVTNTLATCSCVPCTNNRRATRSQPGAHVPERDNGNAQLSSEAKR